MICYYHLKWVTKTPFFLFQALLWPLQLKVVRHIVALAQWKISCRECEEQWRSAKGGNKKWQLGQRWPDVVSATDTLDDCWISAVA